MGRDDAENFKVDGLTVRIVYDTDCESSNPRENCDNLGIMVCWHRRYALGDVAESKQFDSPAAFREWADDKANGVALCLPLYLYDHSGITMNTTGFSCRWDSGQVGYIYVTRDKLHEEYGKRITKKTLETARQCLVSEVEGYDSFIRGEVYGYVVEDSEGNHLDSCWGFVGNVKYVKEAARESAEWHAKKIFSRETESAGDVPDVAPVEEAEAEA